MFCGVGDCEQHDTTDNWRYAKKCQSWSLLLRPSCECRTSHSSDDLNCAEGDVEEDGVKAVETETFDDQGAKSCDATAGDSALC